MPDFGSGHDLTVLEFESHMGLSADSREPAWDSPSPSLSAPPPHSLSKINKIKHFLKLANESLPHNNAWGSFQWLLLCWSLGWVINVLALWETSAVSFGSHQHVCCWFVFNIYLVLRDRVRAQVGEGQRVKEVQNLKQVPGSELSAQSPMGAGTHKPWDPDLSQRWVLNQLSHPTSHWFLKLDILRGHLVQEIQIWVPDVGYKSFTLRGDVSHLWFPSQLQIAAPGMVFMVRPCLSLFYPPWCGPLSRLPMWMSCSASFQIFFRANFSTCTCRFNVSMGGVGFRIFLHCHLEPPSSLSLSLSLSLLLSLFLKLFILRERESKRAQVGEGQRERRGENPSLLCTTNIEPDAGLHLTTMRS